MPGVGLLLFRLLLSSMLVAPWGLRGALPPDDLLGLAWVAAALIAFGALLPLGIGGALLLAGLDGALDGWPLAGLLLALLLLGPGAYSVDAVLFGRRVLELPASRRGHADDKDTHPKE
jgi:hypothetical protein